MNPGDSQLHVHVRRKHKGTVKLLEYIAQAHQVFVNSEKCDSMLRDSISTPELCELVGIHVRTEQSDGAPRRKGRVLYSVQGGHCLLLGRRRVKPKTVDQDGMR